MGAFAYGQGSGYPSLDFNGYQTSLIKDPFGGRVAVGYAVSSDHKGDILIGGAFSDAAGVYHMAVLRLERDGTLDPLFGSGGGVYAAADPPDLGTAMAVDGRGRVLVAGLLGASFNQSGFAVLRRFLPDGKPDPSFARGALIRAAGPFGGHAAAYAVAVQGPRILIAGTVSGPKGSAWGAVWRFWNGGLPDVSFGRNGVVLLPAPPGAQAQVRALLLGPDHSVLAAGSVAGRMALWKISAQGHRDKSFGINGVAVGLPGQARGLAADASGDSWLTGFRNQYNPVVAAVARQSAAVALFTPKGASDGNFSRWGTVALPTPELFSNAQAFAMAPDPHGGFYAAGYARGPSNQACFWAFDSSGRLITGFGSNGILVLPNAPGGVDDRAYAIAFDRSGRILAAGLSRDKSGEIRLALWRVQPAGY